MKNEDEGLPPLTPTVGRSKEITLRRPEKHAFSSRSFSHFVLDWCRYSSGVPKQADDPKRRLLTEQLADELANLLLNEKIPLDIVQATTGEIIIPANCKITRTLLRKLTTAHDDLEIDPSPLRDKIRAISSHGMS